MTDAPKFQFGQTLEIAPTLALALEAGEIVITGILYPTSLPEYIDQKSWLIGDAEFDFAVQTEPWYFYQYVDEDLEGETYDLPQFALIEAMNQAARNK